MHHGRRWASCALGVLLVGLATLWGGGGKESHAQPGVLDAGEKKAETLPLPPESPGDLAFPVRTEPAAEPRAPEDPEQAAEAFVDQTRQQAEGQIKALTAEADQLRARLKKVEAALQRWQGLRAALDAKPGPGAAAELPLPALESRAETPATLPGPAALEPAPAATPIAPPPGAAVESEPVLTIPGPK